MEKKLLDVPRLARVP